MKWIHAFMASALCNSILITSVWAFGPCHDSINHEPRADVVYNPSPVIVPDPVMIPITFDMVEKYNLNDIEGVDLKPTIGVIEIYKDGRILYDGKDISQDIKDECENNDSDSPETKPEKSQNSDNTNTGG